MSTDQPVTWEMVWKEFEKDREKFNRFAFGPKPTSACAPPMSAFRGKAAWRYTPQMSAFDPKW